jgi:CO dehydrogenase maturation factor
MKTEASRESLRLLPLNGKRLLVCGKGGSGKSSLLVLMARALAHDGYRVLALDGDASNPGGLARLLLGAAMPPPRPLIDFFGGRARVTCPVDDPAPLTRSHDITPIPARPLHLNEIGAAYKAASGPITLLQVGKITTAMEGCDGPMSKVTRDLLITDDAVMLIDIEAGVEHFGRGVEQHVDAVLTIVDPSYESFRVADRVAHLCEQMGLYQHHLILNKIDTPDTEALMRTKLHEYGLSILGVVHHDARIMSAGLRGCELTAEPAADEIRHLLTALTNHLHYTIVPHARVA